MKRALTSFALCLTVWTSLTVETRAKPGVTPIGLIPAGSVAVLRMNWSAVRRDARLKDIVKGDDLERVMSNAGINSGDVTDLVIFLDISNPTDARSAMVMTGGARLRTAANKPAGAGWNEGNYRGYKLLTDSSEANCLADLKLGFVVLGTKSGVEAIIDTEQAPHNSVLTDARFRRLLAQSDAARHPISLVMALPPTAQDAGDIAVKAASFLLDFTSFAPLGKLLNKVGLARGISFSMTHAGVAFPVSFMALMKDDSAAGLDMLLVSTAQTSFNYMMVGAILGAVAGGVISLMIPKSKGAGA